MPIRYFRQSNSTRAPSAMNQAARIRRLPDNISGKANGRSIEPLLKRYPASFAPMRAMLALGRLPQHGQIVGTSIGGNARSPSADAM